MRNRVVFAVVAFALLLSVAPASAGTVVDDALKDFPTLFSWLSADKFTQIGVSDAYSMSYQGIDAYIYRAGDAAVVAVVLPAVPSELASITSAFGINVEYPFLFWTKEEADLKRNEMPAALASWVETKPGMPATVRAAAGINLFGRFSSSDKLKSLNLPPLFLGFSSKDDTSTVTMLIPSGSSWQKPFYLSNATVKSGVVRIISTKTGKNVEALTTASLQGAPSSFTMYVKHDGTNLESVGFDTGSASLKDVAAILIAAGSVAKIPFPSIPLPPDEAVKLTNENYQAYVDSSLPDSDTFKRMMFQVTLTKDGDAELNVNAKGEVFRVGVAALTLNASSTGISLAVPAECPLRPVGLKVDLAAANLPVQATLEDCFSAEIMKIVNGVADVSTETYESAAKAAGTAAALSSSAATSVADFSARRATAWTSAIVEVDDAGSAADSAKKALSTATDTVNTLTNTVANLGTEIYNLTKEIDDLWGQIWSWVSDKIDDLTEKKSQKTAERDETLTKLADAELTKSQAEKAAADAEKGLGKAGANLTATVADAGHKLLAATAQRDVQAHVASYAKELKAADVVAAAGPSAQALMADTRAYFATATTQTGDARPSLSAVVQRRESLATSKKAIVAKSVSTLIESETQKQLEATVPTLPTMAFDVPVRIMPSADSCLRFGWGNPELFNKQPCQGTPDEVFVFKADGRLQFPAGSSCVSLETSFPQNPNNGGPLAIRFGYAQECNKLSGRFFFDPVDGLIRFVVRTPTAVSDPAMPEPSYSPKDIPMTLFAGIANARVSPGGYSYEKKRIKLEPMLPPQWVSENYTDPRATKFRLIPADAWPPVMRVGAADGSGGAAESNNTNLAPLRLPVPKK